MNAAILKTQLLCLGARTNEAVEKGRKGGAGPPGRCFILPSGLSVNVPLRGEFVKNSPFELFEQNGSWQLLKDGEFHSEIEALPRPKFYEKKMSDGTPMWKIALLCGRGCLASTVYQKCVYWRSNNQCKFCGIELSLRYGTTIELKTGMQLGEVAAEAAKEGLAQHLTLTTGTSYGPDKGAKILSEATKGVKSAVNILVHVQLEPPDDIAYLEMLYGSGADTVGIHVESFDDDVLKKVCPMKPSLTEYLSIWKSAVKIFGEEQVSSFMIAGLGETDESIIDGAEEMSRIGVIPLLLPLRPIVGTEFESQSPPTPERMIRLYQAVCEVMKSYGIDPQKNKAGCARCGNCSALTEFYTI